MKKFLLTLCLVFVFGFVLVSQVSADWVARTSSGIRNWRGIASSSDGNKLAAVAYEGYIYTSTNGGMTWAERNSLGAKNWWSIASSADGTKLVAVALDDYIYTSIDSGATWKQRTSSGNRRWFYVTSSTDGTKLAATVSNGGYIYTSNDSGVTWVERQQPGLRNWTYITSSADGSKLFATYNALNISEGSIYTSIDSGATWTELQGSLYKGWNQIRGSVDGSQLIGSGDQKVYLSNDGGENWTKIKTARPSGVHYVASSTDGTKLIVETQNHFSNQYLYTSNDSGLTWTEHNYTEPLEVRGIASSASGAKAAATTLNGYIYTYTADNIVPTVTLSATPTNVDFGGATQLTWTVTDADSCTASGGWTGTKNASGGSQIIGNLTNTTVFNLECTGSGGSSTGTVTVTVNPLAPIVNLSANPFAVPKNGDTTLTWTVENANTCSASSNPNNSGWNSSTVIDLNSTNNSKVISNLTQNTTFTLTCTGAGVEVSASISVNVFDKPIITLNANPNKVNYDGASMLTWTVTNANSCTASGGWTGTKDSTGGSQLISNLKNNTTFILTCNGNGGESSVSVLVEVNPKNASVTLNANPIDIAKNGGTDLTWTSNNATSCTASSVPSTSFAGSRELNSVTPERVDNISANTTFTLTCENSAGIKSESSVLVKVTPVPTVTFSANTNKVLPGGFVDLTLDTKDADSCIASSSPNTTWSNPNNKPVNQIYTERVLDIDQKTTFVIVCSSLGGVISKEIVVDIIAEKLTFNNTKVLRDSATGQYKTTLSWVLTNMTGCKASTKNPTSGLVWGDTYINIPDSPTSNSKSNVLVTAPDTTDKAKKNEYILSCFGKNSGKPATASLFLDINDLASSGTGIPDYEEN